MRSARRKKTHPSTRTAFESLESRAMLAGLGTDSLSGLGSTTGVLLPGVSSPAGIVLTGGSPTLGSASGTSGSQPNGPVLLGGSGSGSGSSTGGSGSSAPNGPVLLSQYNVGSSTSGRSDDAQFGGSANTAENVAGADSIQIGGLLATVGLFADDNRARAIGGGIGMVVGTAAGAVAGTVVGAAGGTLALPGGGTVAGAGIGGLEGAAYGGAIGGMMGIYLADLASLLLRKRQEAAPPVNAPAENVDESGVDPVDVMTDEQKRKAVESLTERILEHQKKLADYAGNPDAYDNQDLLKNAPSAEVRERIINGRIKHLQNEIKAFEDAITRLLGKR